MRFIYVLCFSYCCVETQIDEKTREVKGKDELVAEKEKLLKQKEDKIASLQTEVSSLQVCISWFIDCFDFLICCGLHLFSLLSTKRDHLILQKSWGRLKNVLLN